MMFDIVPSWKYWLPVAVLYPIGALVWPLVFPTIISYPWTPPDRRQNNTVILAGSFNPPHLGHFAMLQYLSQKHDKVICVVGCNPNKTYNVLPQDRARLLRTMFATTQTQTASTAATATTIDNVHSKIEVQVVTTYIWRYAKTRQCRILYRGIRSWEKDGKEETALHILNTWGPLLLGPTWPIPSHYLEGKPEYNHISSSLIRSLLTTCDGDYDLQPTVRNEIAKLVPESIVDETIRLYSPTSQERT